MTIEDRLRAWKIPVGMRTIKTTIAVILALLVVQPYGTSTAKVVFATIGAMSAVGPTFKASAVACLTQICSVTVGAVMAVIMAELKVPPMAAVGIGIIILLWMYQYSHLKLLPVLPCLVLVNICLTPEIEAAPYALGRLWDTAIGLGIGMLINTLVFPYDNSQKIRQTMVSLDSDLIEFLEDMFDGDEHQPEAKNIGRKIAALEGQIARVQAEQAAKATDYVALQELQERQAQLEAALEEKMERWVYLNDLAERIAAQENETPAKGDP